MAMVPIPSAKTDLPFVFDISMGIRRGDDVLYDRVEKAIDRNRADITKILKDYGVPLLDRKASAK
jgi:mxaJ protein